MTESAVRISTIARAARLSQGALLCYVVALAALHALRPDLNPATHIVSAYAIGPSGWLMRSTFFVLSLGSGALLTATAYALPGGSSARIGQTFLGFWAVAVAFSGVFPADLPGAVPTPAGRVHHLLALVAFPSVVTAMFTLNVAMGRPEPLRGVNRARSALAIAALLLLVGSATVLAPMGFVGIGQRLFLVTILGWHALAASRIPALGGEASR